MSFRYFTMFNEDYPYELYKFIEDNDLKTKEDACHHFRTWSLALFKENKTHSILLKWYLRHLTHEIVTHMSTDESFIKAKKELARLGGK